MGKKTFKDSGQPNFVEERTHLTTNITNQQNVNPPESICLNGAVPLLDNEKVNVSEDGENKNTTPVYNPDMTLPLDAKNADVPSKLRVKSPAIQNLEHQVDDVVVIVRENVEKILNRNERLSLLESRTDVLLQGSQEFQKVTNYLKQKYWWRNLKMRGILYILTGLLISALIIWILTRNPDRNVVNTQIVHPNKAE